MSKYGLGDFQQALRAYLQSGLDSGQVADAGNVPNTYLTAANKRWVIDQWVGCYVQITDGLAIGQFLQVASNTVDTMIFVEPWIPVIPDTTSIYKIMLPSPGMGVGTPVEITNTSDIESSIDSGIITARTANTLSDTNKNWPVNGLADALVKITEGVGVGQLRIIASNTATQLTVASNWATQPAVGASYSIISLGGGGGGVPAGVYESAHISGDCIADVLDITLDTGESGGRNTVNIYIESSVDATWSVMVSTDNVTWRLVDLLNIVFATPTHTPYTDNAYRYIRVLTGDVGNHELEIVASR